MSGIRRVATVCLLGGAILLVDAEAQTRGFGEAQADSNGRKVRAGQEAPSPGLLNGAAAVEALRGELGQRVRDRGEDADRYAEALAADESLWIAEDGQLMFFDVVEHDLAAEVEVVPGTTSTSTAGPAPTPTSVLPNGLPIHHSKPGAPWTIYVAFEGQVFRSTAWPIGSGVTTALTIDGDASTFNIEEQAVISRIWGRVAEDWAPFDVDVTTEHPGTIGSTVLWAIVARSGTQAGFPSNFGGVALFSLGGVAFGARTPSFTFWEPLGATDHSSIADVITQEAGHMFGLAHDGMLTPNFAEYYAGHGTGPTSWGPVMGYPIARNVTQWSRGEYTGAAALFGSIRFPPQDDIAIIGARLGFRADDFADDPAGALSLASPRSAFITSPTDVDVFVLPAANEVRIEVTPFRAGELTDGGNLDVAAEILDANGAVVASVDDIEETAATLAADLPNGTHYLRVRSSSNPANYSTYASLGAYTVTGTFVRSVKTTGFTEPLTTSVFTAGRTVPVRFSMTDSVAAARVQLWPSSVAPPAGALAESACKEQTDRQQHCTLKLPSTLVPGATYWIAAQFQNLDGAWVTPQTVSATAVPNPLLIVVQ